MKTSTFAYDLPEHLIAQEPLAARDASRLLVVRPGTPPHLQDAMFRDLAEVIAREFDGWGGPPLFVRNASRVYPARVRTRRQSGARGEVLFLEIGEREAYRCMMRPLKKLRPGEVLLSETTQEPILRVVSVEPPLVAPVGQALDALLERFGEMPLPPYIVRDPNRVGDRYAALDRERYQTVYGRDLGSAAAPTAGLHFTDDVIAGCRAKGCDFVDVTLHVGLGTFQPVQVEEVDDHPMHEEWCLVDRPALHSMLEALKAGRPIIYVGTTALRTVESFFRQALPAEILAKPRPLRATDLAAVEERLYAKAGEWFSTRLFIRPHDEKAPRQHPIFGHGMLTNFHQPESTLVMLVAALLGMDCWRATYGHAVREGYRFLSYGDSSLLVLSDGKGSHAV